MQLLKFEINNYAQEGIYYGEIEIFLDIRNAIMIAVLIIDGR